ncbi:MAG: hypothetical protein CMJ78_06825 [Planctomycetaceae bacterium]|nr:hypothetical protein [Planctomycetaceae bacterium]
MQKREKILAIAFVGVLGFWVVLPKIADTILKPVHDAQTKLYRAERAVAELREAQDEAIASMGRMKGWKERALPGNLQEATLIYQQWLSDLVVNVAQFSNPKVTPERSSSFRDKPYLPVAVTVTGNATMHQYREFMFRLHQVDLLQSVKSISLENVDGPNQDNLSVRLVVESVSIPGVERPGRSLFARTTVGEVEGRKLRVRSMKDFPEAAPFVVRVGSDYVTVVGVEELELTISDDDPELTAAADTVVEHVPIAESMQGKTVDDFSEMLELNPFMKPRIYNTRIELAGSPTVYQGEELKLEAKPMDWNPKFGKPKFRLEGTVPKGLTLESQTGVFQWKPTEGIAFADFPMTIQATADGMDEPIQQPVVVKYTMKNEPPTVEPIEAKTAVIGAELRFPIKATDDLTPAEQLGLTLAGAPEGASIDASTREFVWTPGEDTELGERSFSLNVADAGGQSTSVAIQVTIQDDTARFTYLTSSVAFDAVKQAWLHDKSTNQKLILQEGKLINYANLTGSVKKIDDQFVLLEIQTGTWRLDLGKNLTQMKKLDEPKSVEPESPESTDTKVPESKSSETKPSTDIKAPSLPTTPPIKVPEKAPAFPNPGDKTSEPTPAAKPLPAEKEEGKSEDEEGKLTEPKEPDLK